MCDGHERVKILRLGAYVIQETRSKRFWNLSRIEKYLKTCVPSEITYNKDSRAKNEQQKNGRGEKPSCIMRYLSAFSVPLH